MINQLTFINQQWFWQIFGIALCIWIIFIWKEWKQNAIKPKLYLKIFIAFIGISALSLIILKPATLKDKGNSKLIVLTNGYQKSQLDSLKKIYKKIKTVAYQSDVSFYKSTHIPSEVFVLGHGIDPFNFWQLDHIKTTFLVGESVSGIVNLNYDDNQVLGKDFELKGYYQSPKLGHILALEGPGNALLDSLVIKDTLNQIFQLNTKLKAEGNFLYQLVEKDSLGALISRDPLPVKVNHQTPIQVLILNGFPTFETKYLKNYLAEMGHQVVIRSQVTTGKFKYEYFNLEQKPLIRITEEDLEHFDLLIVDSKSLKNFSNANRTVLENVISNEGLGLIIQPDDNYFSGQKVLSNFQFVPSTQTEIELKRWPKSKISTYPYQFKLSLNDISIQNAGTKVLSAYHYLGIGKVATTTFQNSYNLVLKGNKNMYETLWSELIDKVSKSDAPKADWLSQSKLAFTNQPFDFKLRTKIPNPIVKDQDGKIIALKQNIDISTLWTGVTYPKSLGWYSLQIAQDSIENFSYYVSDSIHFNALRNQYNVKQNQGHFQHETSALGIQKYPNPIAPIWFYIVFLLSFGYLWLAPKL